MRTHLVAGNWKMNLTIAQAAATVESFVRMVDAKASVDVVVCPPYLAIPKVRELLRDTHIKIGAQDLFWEQWGAFTGQVGPAMLVDAGVGFCILGHSERRGRFGNEQVSNSLLNYFCENEASLNAKVRAALYHGINPILCVGETRQERDAGRTEDVVRGQLLGALEGVEGAELFFSLVAYEPVWAIGTGDTCPPDEANRMCGFIRGLIAERYDDELAENFRILYGGSVKAANAAELFAEPDIDGALVGGASLDPNEFARIVMSA